MENLRIMAGWVQEGQLFLEPDRQGMLELNIPLPQASPLWSHRETLMFSRPYNQSRQQDRRADPPGSR